MKGTILEKIIQQKRVEVNELKVNGIGFSEISNNTIHSFYESCMKNEHMSVISEVKRASPSKGNIYEQVDPVDQAIQYENANASAISVLTDETFFKGSIEDLKRIREAVQLPILCKDFIIDSIQIDRAKSAGASIILLIVAALEEEKLLALYRYAVSKGLEVIIEVHNEDEVATAVSLNPRIIGINNRDLKTFEVDLGTTTRLRKLILNPTVLVISESGLKTKKDAILAKEAGARCILVGETLMRSENILETMSELQVSLEVSSDESKDLRDPRSSNCSTCN
jgi:indole-3-glycerol phosphate synthase